MNQSDFKTPCAKYKMNTIVHAWPKEYKLLVDAIKAFGYGGCATNPEYSNGYMMNPENTKNFGEVIQYIKKSGMTYWIYDEKGYPSGLGGGQSLGKIPHISEESEANLFATRRSEILYPELEAKGFYMVRRIAYEPRHISFMLDDESDKIIWAAKYPMDVSEVNTSRIIYEQMEPVFFSDTSCECELEQGEVFFAFCTKPAYEGSHLTHNVSSRSRYINILDAKAVRRFLEVGYEPIADALPDAYRNADAVFTDEPSLQTPYMHGDEVWPYALAPWVEGLFEAFEEMYGYSLLPFLPQIFEGRSVSYKTRVDFYELIGSIIAKSYVAQIREWCNLHGTKFSGHYLAEEYITFHVLYYGSYLKVLQETDIQGCDVLAAHPGVYHYNTTRFAQMAARKKDMDGIMTELCPFMDMEIFEKNPVKNALGIINLLYLGGCRRINSYFSANFKEYNSEKLADYTGYMSMEDAKLVNNYVARLGVMLSGAHSKCRTAVYYPLEDVQAKTRPWHCARESADCGTDRSLIEIVKTIYEQGEDYIIVDHSDIVEMVEGRSHGCESIENIIIPAVDVIWSDAYDGFIKLQNAGKHIWFYEKVPLYRADVHNDFKYYDFREESLGLNDITKDAHFAAVDKTAICRKLNELKRNWEITARSCEDGKEISIIQACYEKEGKTILFIVNNTMENAVIQLSLEYENNATQISIWNPENGEIETAFEGMEISLDSYKGKFVVVEQESPCCCATDY